MKNPPHAGHPGLPRLLLCARGLHRDARLIPTEPEHDGGVRVSHRVSGTGPVAHAAGDTRPEPDGSGPDHVAIPPCSSNAHTAVGEDAAPGGRCPHADAGAGSTALQRDVDPDGDVSLRVGSTRLEQDLRWQRTYGDGHGKAIIRDGTGYVVVAATSPGVRVLKIGPSGETRWSHDVAGTGRPTSIVRTSGGTYVISGFLEEDGWLLEVTGHGEIEWSRTFGGAADDIFHGLTRAPDGGVVDAGYSNSGEQSQLPWVLKVDGTGTKKWERLLGAGSNENGGWAEAIVRVDAGGYALTGYRATGNGIALWNLGADGHVEWNRTYTSGSGESLIVERNGYAIAGFRTAEAAVLTTDGSGTPRSFAEFGRDGFAYGYSIARADGDAYVIAGRYEVANDGSSSKDALLFKMAEES